MRKAIWCVLILTLVGCGRWLYQFQNDLMFREAAQKPDNVPANEAGIKAIGRTTPVREYSHRDYGDIKFFNQDTRTTRMIQTNSNDSSSSITNNVQKKLATGLQALAGSITPEADDDEAYTIIAPPNQNGANQNRTPWSFQASAPATNNALPRNNAPAPNNAPNMQNKPSSAPTPPNAATKP